MEWGPSTLGFELLPFEKIYIKTPISRGFDFILIL